MLVGGDDRRRHFRSRQQRAVIGGDEVGADPRGDIAAAIMIELGNPDPLHRGMARRDLAAKQPDAAGADDGKPDAFGVLLHTLRPARLRCLSSAIPEIVSLLSGKSIGSLRSADRSAAL